MIVAGCVGLATVRLVRPRRGGTTPVVPARSALRWAAGYVACVLVYVVLYFVTGALNYVLVTGP